MFIYNFKINSNFFLKLFLAILLGIVLAIVIFSIYKLFNNSVFTVNDDLNKPNVYSLSTSNYTNVLKTIHDNLDDYVGQQINFSGYVYRVYDFDDTQFVLARDMVISSDYQTLVVGFLCHCDTASSYSDGTWINITRNNNKRRLSWRNPLNRNYKY